MPTICQVYYSCPCCERRLRSAARDRGRAADCPSCARRIAVPVAGGDVIIPTRQPAPTAVGLLPAHPQQYLLVPRVRDEDPGLTRAAVLLLAGVGVLLSVALAIKALGL